MEDKLYKCSKCCDILDDKNSYKSKDKKYKNRGGFLYVCVSCTKKHTTDYSKTDRGRELHRLREAKRRMKDQPRYLWFSAKRRAESKGLEFSITIDDIIIPEYCPVFNIKLKPSDGIVFDKDNSPSIDRINSSKGYTKDNIIVISNRANILKNNATVDEILALANFYGKI